MITAKIRKSGFGFFTDPKRLNVAIIKAISAFFFVAELDALSNHKLVTQSLKDREELDSEVKNEAVDDLIKCQNHIMKLADFYKQAPCFKTVDLSLLPQKYV